MKKVVPREKASDANPSVTGSPAAAPASAPVPAPPEQPTSLTP